MRLRRRFAPGPAGLVARAGRLLDSPCGARLKQTKPFRLRTRQCRVQRKPARAIHPAALLEIATPHTPPRELSACDEVGCGNRRFA